MMGGRRSGELTEGQAALRRLVALGAALVALVLIGSAAVLAEGSQALDALQAHEDRHLAASGLNRSLNRLITDLTTSTVWDQAYKNLRPGGPDVWLDQEIGSYFAHNRGHDRTVAIDGHGKPFYAWAGDGRVAPAEQGEFLRATAPLVRAARAQEAARGAKPPKVAPTDPALAETASGVVVFQGRPFLAAASTVTPENAGTPRAPGPAPLVISGEWLDHKMLTGLDQIGLGHARFAAAVSGDPHALTIVGADGRRIGEVVWDAERPGLAVLRAAAPALVAGFLIVGLLAAALGWQIFRVARRLDMHERAHDQALRDLEEARDRAESANIAKSQFLANMSHEIRTPLNGVLGMAQVLAKSDLADGDREKVQVIRASGETLLGLLNDLLDLSKIEAGRMEVDVHEFDLEEAVAAATRSFATLAAQKDVRFLVTVEPEARGVWKGDGGKARQVLANLVSNAVKFTGSGEIRTTVRRTEDGIACTVSDTGAGIARERLEQLFKRFSQVDPSATRRFGGTGLGLAIVRELVELMGGTVGVTSVEGRGSAFTFSLPLEWIGPSAASERPADAEPELPPLRILAAEDNKTNQLLLTAMLAPMGVDLRVTADGEEALAAFAAEPFDMVLMDVQMPRMNGVDATRAMRQIEAERGFTPTPILALSANVMRHQIDEYLAAGMNGFIAKPIEMAALVDAIEQTLAEAGNNAATRAA